jgi:hypothetical protein
VKVAGGGRGVGAIAAHLSYIAKPGRLPVEADRGPVREDQEALRLIADPWRLGGTRILEVSERREAFDIMLSMPTGTDARVVRQAARELAKAELANHRYFMVLHTHQATWQVQISVRTAGCDGKRLNSRKEHLHRWRETFAEKLRGWGIEAAASLQATRDAKRRRRANSPEAERVQVRVRSAGHALGRPRSLRRDQQGVAVFTGSGRPQAQQGHRCLRHSDGGCSVHATHARRVAADGAARHGHGSLADCPTCASGAQSRPGYEPLTGQRPSSNRAATP